MTKKLRLAHITLVSLSVFLYAYGISYAQTGGKLYTDPSSLTIGVDQYFKTDIVVDTGGNKAGGVGAILLYDTSSVVVDHVETGTAFSDYPLAAFDNEQGKVAISGVVGSPDQLVSGILTVGKVYWKALKLGSTTIRFDYTPQSTTDSNVAVTTGSGDALTSVKDLTVDVVADPQPAGITIEPTPEPTEAPVPATPEPTPQSFVSQVGSFFNRLLGREEQSPEIATAPLQALPPKTDFKENPQPETAEQPSTSGVGMFVPIVAVVVLAVAIFVIILKVLRRKRGGGGSEGGSSDSHIVTSPSIAPISTPAPPVAPVSTTEAPAAPMIQPQTPAPQAPAPQPKQEPQAPIITRR